MRVALVVHKFPPASVGGTEVYTSTLASQLAKLGHEVTVFSRRDSMPGDESSPWDDREGFRVFFAGRLINGSKNPLSVFLDTFFNRDIEQRFCDYLEEAVPEVVHFQHLMSLSYRLVTLVRSRGLPVLLTLHDYWFLCANSQLVWPDGTICQGKAWGLNCARCALANSGLPFAPLLRPLAAPLLHLRDILVRRAALEVPWWIAPSRFLIERYVDAGFPAHRFSCLENGLDVERIWAYPRSTRADQRVRFTYLGSLAWQKGVHVLVDAFRGVPSDRALLQVYGDPEVFPEYSARLRDMADASNTRFLGRVPNDEVGRVLAETDVLAVPSLWYENSPLVIQEAFAAGVPVLASRLGALEEKVGDGESGWLCDPGDVGAWRKGVEKAMDQAHLLLARTPEPVSMKEHTQALLSTYGALSGVTPDS